jgi:hypothetical protein
MKKLAWMALSGTILLITGCASLTPEQCKSVNPQTQGLADGRAGRTTASVDEVVSTCQSNGSLNDVGAFKNTYLKAYQQGLAEYCTPANGERVGLLGEEYLGVCPKENEAPFLKEYLYALKQYNDAHPQPDPYYYPRHRMFFDPFYDPFWGGRYYGRHSHIRGFVRGGW